MIEKILSVRGRKRLLMIGKQFALILEERWSNKDSNWTKSKGSLVSQLMENNVTIASPMIPNTIPSSIPTATSIILWIIKTISDFSFCCFGMTLNSSTATATTALNNSIASKLFFFVEEAGNPLLRNPMAEISWEINRKFKSEWWWYLDWREPWRDHCW